MHYGSDKPSTSTGKRPIQVHSAIGCQMHVKLVLQNTINVDECYLEVTQLSEVHNHEVSAELYKWYPKQWRLDGEKSYFVQELIKGDVKPSQIKLILHDQQEDKCVTSQDVRNTKSKMKASERKGKCESELLVDTVRKLLSNDPESKVKILTDNDDEVQAVCFMSGQMQRLYREYGQVLFIEATYKVDIEGFPLLVFLVEDGTGIGVPVLFGFVKHETTDILHNVLEWFTESVDIAVTRVIMVDKDLKMLNLLQATFSKSTVLLCRFHVLRLGLVLINFFLFD